MGQKYSEVPSVDYWVQLTRSADRAGAGSTLPVREVDGSTDFGRWELDRFALMQRYRNRTLSRMAVLPGDVTISPDYCCIRCGRMLYEESERVIARSVWPQHSERYDLYRCADTERCG